MGEIANVYVDNKGGKVVKGSRAGESFASSDEIKAKRKADEYRKSRRKSFAWKPPAKAGLDPDWDSFDPDKVTPPPAKPAAPGLSSIKK